MAGRNSVRLTFTLDAEHAAKLSRLAERAHTQERTLARSLLAQALDEADPGLDGIADVLDEVPGAYERALLGRTEAKNRRTIPLDDL